MKFSFLSLMDSFGRVSKPFHMTQPERYAHLVVDVQRHFCDPRTSEHGTRQTDAVAREIARVTPIFREAGMKTYMVYFQKWSEPPEKAFGGFHRVQPAASDVLLGKITPSAFEYNDLAERLRNAGIDTLLVSGFQLNNCVNATVQSALREDFKVWALSDCIGNGIPCTEDPAIYWRLMREHGAEIITTKQAMTRLQTPSAG